MIKKLPVYVLAGFLISAVLTPVVFAADFVKPDGSTGNVTIGQSGLKNLYTAGNIVTINAGVQKDLVVAGNILNINGKVEDDLIAAGGTVMVKGDVGGTARVAGGNVVIEGNIVEDLFIAGGNVNISRTAKIESDLIMGVGNASVEGEVVGDVKIGGGQVTLNGKVGGSVDARIDKFEIGPEAIIAGDLIYSSKEEASIADGAQILGEIRFEEWKGTRGETKKYLGIFTTLFLVQLLALIAVALVLIYFFRKHVEQTVSEALTRFWPSMGIGFAALILTPIAAIILAITVVGLGLTILIGLGYMLALFLSVCFGGIIFGSWMVKMIKKHESYRVSYESAILGIIVLGLIGLIPVIGWIVGFVFFLISLGAIYRVFYRHVVLVKRKTQ